MIFNRKSAPVMGDPDKIIYKLELQGSITNSAGIKIDLYLLCCDNNTGDSITLAVPHGREDIAQYIQERLNKV